MMIRVISYAVKSIINYLATDKAFKNTQKSEWHMNTILLFVEKK